MREGSFRSATKGLQEAPLGSMEGGNGRTQALSILMLPHLPKSGQRQPEAGEQKHNFHQKDVSCPRTFVSLKLVLHPLGWEHPQIQNGESLKGQLSLWKNPRSQGPSPPPPCPLSNLSWYLLLPRNSQCSPAEKKLKLLMLGLDGVPGGGQP